MVEHIPTILKAEMSRQGIIYAELSAVSGINISTLNNITLGQTRPRIDNLLAILKGLGKDLTWLDQEMRAASGETVRQEKPPEPKEDTVTPLLKEMGEALTKLKRKMKSASR